MVVANNSINNTVGASISGVTNTLTITNPSDTASSQALVNITVGGTSSGDAFETFTIAGTTNWSQGIDNSVSDNFVIAASTALGTTNVMSMTTAGAVSAVLGNLDVTRSASGADVSTTASNTSNTASSSATVYATVAGTSGGDARTQYAVTGTTTWTQGIDNSVTGDPFVIAASSALGTTNIMSATTSGEINYPLQPAFCAEAVLQTNVTGAGTSYTVIFATEVFDQGGDYNAASGVFTAPVTGRYFLSASVTFLGLAAGNTTGTWAFNASNRQFIPSQSSYGAQRNAGNIYGVGGACLADMDAADTVSIGVAVSGGTDIVDIGGASYFSGNLAC